jgi:transcriptional regulator with XRE-family HTH domain
MNNILVTNLGLGNINASAIINTIAQKVRRNRLELNLTQKALATRAGISFGSLRRFENTGEISLKSLILIAIALDATDEFDMLFTKQKYQSIDQLVNEKQSITKKRGRKTE